MPDPIVGEQQFIPNPALPKYRTRFYRVPESGQMVLQYSLDAGTSWKELTCQPPSSATPGYVQTISDTGGMVWVPVSSLFSTTKKSSSSSINWSDFSFPGTLQLDTKFGYFAVPENSPYECYGAQAVIFNSPTGRDVTVDIFSVDNSSFQNKVIRLSQGQIFEQTFFDTPLRMEPGTGWQLGTTQIGDTVPGDFLLCRLMLKPL